MNADRFGCNVISQAASFTFQSKIVTPLSTIFQNVYHKVVFLGLACLTVRLLDYDI